MLRLDRRLAHGPIARWRRPLEPPEHPRHRRPLGATRAPRDVADAAGRGRAVCVAGLDSRRHGDTGVSVG